MNEIIPPPTTSFDMRLEYYQGIGEMFRALNMFVSMRNYDPWYRALTQLVNMHPFLTEKELAQCDGHASRIRQYLSISESRQRSTLMRQQSQQYQMLAENELNALTRFVIRAYQKHNMLLPEKELDEELSDAEIARQMGL